MSLCSIKIFSEDLNELYYDLGTDLVFKDFHYVDALMNAIEAGYHCTCVGYIMKPEPIIYEKFNGRLPEIEDSRECLMNLYKLLKSKGLERLEDKLNG